MRISDWSSDVCSSDLKPAFSTVCRLGRLMQTSPIQLGRRIYRAEIIGIARCGASGRRVGVSTHFYLIFGNGKIGAVLHSIKASQFLNPPSSPAHSHSEAVKLDVWKRIYARLGQIGRAHV